MKPRLTSMTAGLAFGITSAVALASQQDDPALHVELGPVRRLARAS